MKKHLTRAALLATPLLCAVECDPGRPESEPNNTPEEAWNNPAHPVASPDIYLGYGTLDYTSDFDSDNWWVVDGGHDGQPLRPGDVPKLTTPLKPSDTSHRFDDLGVRRLAFTNGGFMAIKKRMHSPVRFDIVDFPLPDGSTISLDVAPTNLLADDAECVIASSKNGRYQERPLEHPDILLLSGSIADEPDSIVFLALSEQSADGFIRRPEQTLIISTENGPGGHAPIIFDVNQVPSELLPIADRYLRELDQPEIQPPPPPDGGGLAGAEEPPPRRRFRIAIDTDNEFCDFFDDDTDATYGYILALIGAANSIFKDAINAELRISYLRLWLTNNDPWTDDPDELELAADVAIHWYINMNHVDRDLMYAFSGRNTFESSAVRTSTGLCDFNMTLMEMSGASLFPAADYEATNWDIVNFCRATGRNLGTLHTHQYCPPLDQCASSEWFGECQTQQVCSNGTIMSHCYACDEEGTRRIQLAFHDQVKASMLDHLTNLTASCDYTIPDVTTLSGVAIITPGDFVLLRWFRVRENPLTGEQIFEEEYDELFFLSPTAEASRIFPFELPYDPSDAYVVSFDGFSDLYIFSLFFGE